MLAGLENEWQQLVVLAALFIGFSHPKVYKMMNDTLGGVLGDALQLVDEEDHPTMVGQVLHAALFVVVWVLIRDAMAKN